MYWSNCLDINGSVHSFLSNCYGAKEQVSNDISLIEIFNKFFSIVTGRKYMEKSNPVRRSEAKQCRGVSRAEFSAKIFSILEEKATAKRLLTRDAIQWDRMRSPEKEK